MAFFWAETGFPGITEKSKFSDFVGKVSKSGIARPTLYRCEIGQPLMVVAKQALFDLTKGDILKTYLDLHYSVESVEFPGTNILQHEVVAGNQDRKYAYARQLQECTIVFRVDSNMSQKKLFDIWQGCIVNPKTKQIGFKNDYVADIKIYQLNEKKEITYSYYLLNAFPTSIGSLSLGYDQTGTYHKLSVTFVFDDYTTSEYVEGVFGNVINSAIDSLVGSGVTSLKQTAEGYLGTGAGIVWDAVKSGGFPIINF